MAEQIAPGIWWLHGTRGSNVYLVEADDGQLALVDTGFGTNVGAILREIASVGGGRPLASILLTHKHFDHVGSARILRERTGARIVIGMADCVRGASGGWVVDAPVGRSHVARFVSRWLLRRHAAGVPVDVPLEGESEVLPGVRSIPAPGHTPGSFCFEASRSRALFVGDLTISHGGSLSRPLASSHADSDQFESTLAEIASYDAAVGCPGHGKPVQTGFSESLRALAACPPRRPTPMVLARRMIRLHGFTLGMYRRRTPRR